MRPSFFYTVSLALLVFGALLIAQPTTGPDSLGTPVAPNERAAGIHDNLQSPAPAPTHVHRLVVTTTGSHTQADAIRVAKEQVRRLLGDHRPKSARYIKNDGWFTHYVHVTCGYGCP